MNQGDADQGEMSLPSVHPPATDTPANNYRMTGTNMHMPIPVLDGPKVKPKKRVVSQAKLDDKELQRAFSPVDWKSKTDWKTLIVIGGLHLGCLAAPFYFTVQAALTALVLNCLCGCIGITLGYHRLLSHRSFKLNRVAQFVVHIFGVLSLQGTPMRWAATHRLHHRRSDQPGDPHSPRDGKWWSHILWLFRDRTREQDRVLYKRYVPDLIDDPMMQFFEKTFIWWSVALGFVLYWVGGWPMVVWGLCVRAVFAYHSTWFVNSATHLWGYRNYETTDDSKNLWWVAFLTFGEGWHNNHHAHPGIAPAGHRWWEFDVTWCIIRALRFCGLATNVRDKIPAPSK